MPHLRSEEKLVQRRIWQRVREYLYKQNLTERQYAEHLILAFSFKDLVNREIVYTESFEGTVLQKLDAAFPDGWKFAVNHDYGDVLNRFPLKPFPIFNYVGRNDFVR